MVRPLKKLRNNPIVKDVMTLAQRMYDIAEVIAADHPDEKWRTATKLQNAVNDSLFYVSQALAFEAEELAQYDLQHARKALASTQTMYMFAAKQHYIEVDPNLVLKIDDLIEQISQHYQASVQADKERAEKELEPWLEKYKLWQKIQDRPEQKP